MTNEDINTAITGLVSVYHKDLNIFASEFRQFICSYKDQLPFKFPLNIYLCCCTPLEFPSKLCSGSLNILSTGGHQLLRRTLIFEAKENQRCEAFYHASTASWCVGHFVH